MEIEILINSTLSSVSVINIAFWNSEQFVSVKHYISTLKNWSCPLFNDSPTRKKLTLVENWSTIGITWITCPCHYIIGSFVQSTLGTRLLKAGHVSTLKTHPNISRIKPMPYRWNIKMSVFFFRLLTDKHLENTSVLYLFTILYH